MTGRAPDGERGSMALELAILAPALLAIIGLLLSYGRYAGVTGQLEGAARDAARGATQSRSQAAAQRQVDAIVTEAANGTPASCRDTVTDTLVGGFQPGDFVTVQVSCTVSFSDLGMWGVPGTTTIQRSFTSPLDPYRGVRQ